MFTCRIETDNAAFEDETELPRLIDHIARRLRVGGVHPREGLVLDSNGNRVGSWALTTDDA